jgi:hypothetical protein
MTKMSDNPSPSLLFEDHVDPAAPADGYHRLFIDTDEKLKMIDHASLVTDFTPGAGGSVATDAIWDAAGDLAVGTGADTAAKLTKGAAGTVPTAGASTLAYAFPPGYEFDYAQITSSVGPTATSEATADTVVTGNAVTYDGSTVVMVEFFCYFAAPDVAAAGRNLNLYLYDGASSIGRICNITSQAATNAARQPVMVARRLTPSNAAHTYSIRASVDAGTGSISASSGGNGDHMPAFIRITKV